MDELRNILLEKTIHSYTMQGISMVYVASADDGLKLASDLLSTSVTTKSLLLLSGGRTPKELYQDLANKEVITPGAVGMIDERYGKKFHEKSNELMLKETGFLRYLEMRNIPFYPVLGQVASRKETADLYDSKLREYMLLYPKTIGILGIGLDGHTAGLPATRSDFQPHEVYKNNQFVTEYNDEGGFYGERVTMTFLGLSQIDLILVLVFGMDKREALEKVFSEGPEAEIPGRFFKRPDIAKKTLFITDQKV